MKKTVKLNERQLNRIVKESVKRILESGRYEGGYNDHGDVEDDNAYVESLDYIIDSIINGNISYAQERISQLNPREVKELILLAREYGCEDDVLRYI